MCACQQRPHGELEASPKVAWWYGAANDGVSTRRLRLPWRLLLAASLVWCCLLSGGRFATGQVTLPGPHARFYCNEPNEYNKACHCPEPLCFCYYEEEGSDGVEPYTTHCRSLKSSTIPTNIYTRTTILILEGQITSLDVPSITHANLPLPLILNVSHNLITELKNRTLRVFQPIEELYMRNNKLSRIESGAFAHFRHLVTLNLEFNLLTSLPAGLFDETINLDYLDLSGNLLTHLPPDLFTHCTFLKHLFLSDNKLEAIPWQTLPLVSNVFEWTLHNNRITSMGQSDFSRTPNLQLLDIDHNKISSLWYAGNLRFPAPYLRKLDMGYNQIDVIPDHFFSGLGNLLELSLAANPLTELIQDGVFLPLSTLTGLVLSDSNMTQIHPFAFSKLSALETLKLDDTPYLSTIPGDLLWVSSSSSSLENLYISGSSFPELGEIGPKCKLGQITAQSSSLKSLKWHPGSELCRLCNKIHTLDFFDSALMEIDPLQNCTELTHLYLNQAKFTSTTIEWIFYNHTALEYLDLSANPIATVSSKVFGYMPSLRHLIMKETATDFDPSAFVGLTNLVRLDLTNSLTTNLPLTMSNSRLLTLILEGAKKMITFPDPDFLPNILVAKLEYQFHCCLFELAALKTQETPSPTPSTLATTGLFDRPTVGTVVAHHGVQFGHVDSFTKEQQDLFDQIWFSNSSNVEKIKVGDSYARDAGLPDQQVCEPRRNAFTPCVDMFSEIWLRIAAWLVSTLALGGNLTVILVIIFGKHKVDNTRFLVLNLAIADLCLGFYLLALCIVDLTTRGEFSKTALDWQYSQAAQFAGFLAIFSTEMSFYTLTLITIERYVTIKLSMDIRYKFTPRRLHVMAVLGWVFAFTLAVLPLVGLSSYTNNIFALPFEIAELKDKAYVGFVLIFNGLCILLITLCYLGIYCEVRISPAFSKNDNSIARRMALLVVVDLMCWLPLAVLGLAATFSGRVLVGLESAKIFTVFVFPLNSCANPFLYALVTNHFQRDLIRILKSFPEKVGDLSRRRSSLKTTPQPSDSKSYLHGVAQYIAQQARHNMAAGEGSGGTSYNNSTGMPPGHGEVPGSEGRAAGSRAGGDGGGRPVPFDVRLAAAALDAESSSEGNSSLMSSIPAMEGTGERRGTIVSFQASDITEITDCGGPPSEHGDSTQTPTPTTQHRRELECSHVHPVPAPVTTGTAVLPEISEQSDPSSSSVSDGSRNMPRPVASSGSVPASANHCTSPAASSSSPPGRSQIAGGLLISALSAFTPMFVGHVSSRAPGNVSTAGTAKTGTAAGAVAASATPPNPEEESGMTQSLTLDKAEAEAMEKDMTPVRADRGLHPYRQRTTETYRAVKRTSADSGNVRRESDTVPTSDETPFAARFIETSL